MLRFPSWQMDCRLRSSELPPSRGRTSRQDQGPGCLWRIGEGLEMLLRISVLFGSIALSSSSSVCETGFVRKLKPCLHHPLSLTWDSYRPILSNFRDLKRQESQSNYRVPKIKLHAGKLLQSWICVWVVCLPSDTVWPRENINGEASMCCRCISQCWTTPATSQIVCQFPLPPMAKADHWLPMTGLSAYMRSTGCPFHSNSWASWDQSGGTQNLERNHLGWTWVDHVPMKNTGVSLEWFCLPYFAYTGCSIRTTLH